MILGTFGASDRFADIPSAPKLSLTSFFVMIYTSSRSLDGRIDTKRLTRPPQPKSNFLYLSVGCGPAHLERLLVARLGIRPEQIVLADISDKSVPSGFKFYQFDMHQDWPKLDGTFDYVIFPESPLINLNFSADIDESSRQIRQPDRERGLYNLLVRSLRVLNSPGQIRLTSGLTQDFVRDPVKAKIEAEFPNVSMGYSGELTYVLKK